MLRRLAALLPGVLNLSEFLNNLDWSVLTDPLLSIIPALICIILHEMSHAYVAYRLGDNTAKELGRLTLNPIKHLDVFGLLAMMFIGFGWAKPVPINPRKFQNPKRGMALTALAGPVSNLLIAVVVLFIYGLLVIPLSKGLVGETILQMVYRLALFSTSLAVFNILPIPPMDGSKFFFAIASDKLYFKVMRYERFGFILILILALSGKLWGPLSVAINFVFDKLFVIAQAGYNLVNLFI